MIFRAYFTIFYQSLWYVIDKIYRYVIFIWYWNFHFFLLGTSFDKIVSSIQLSAECEVGGVLRNWAQISETWIVEPSILSDPGFDSRRRRYIKFDTEGRWTTWPTQTRGKMSSYELINALATNASQLRVFGINNKYVPTCRYVAALSYDFQNK